MQPIMGAPNGFHAKPRRTLAKIIEQYGEELIDDPRRTEALLNDLCGQYTREIFVLIQTQRRRAPAELRDAPAWIPLSSTVNRLARQLETQLALTEEAARWAVESWALALGLMQESPQSTWSKLLPTGWIGNRPPANTQPANAGPERSGGRGAAPSSGASAPAAPAATQTASRQGTAPRQATLAARAFGALLPQHGGNGVKSKPGEASQGKQTRKAKRKSAPRSRRKGVRLAQFPAYLRKQAPNAILWAVVLLSSLFLGWAVLNGSVLSGGLPPSTGLGEASPTPVTRMNSEPSQPVTPLPGQRALTLLYTPQVATVNAPDGLNIRPGPSTAGNPVGWLNDRDVITIAAFSPDAQWAQLAPPATGWVHTGYLVFATAGGHQVRVALWDAQVLPHVESVVVYQEPSMNAPEASATGARLSRGDEVTVIAATLDNTWLQISSPIAGWIMSAAVAGSNIEF